MRANTMTTRLTICDYSLDRHEFVLVAPTPELHERARKLPGAREQKKQGCWVVPATPALAARVTLRYRKVGLELTKSASEYMQLCSARDSASQLARLVKSPRPIPFTRVQPTGRWLHQLRAFWFAYPLEAAMLHITMGGGKTKVAIDLALNWKARSVLIISPLAAIEDAWAPSLEKHMLHGYDALYLDSGTLKQRTERARQLFESEVIAADSFRHYSGERGSTRIVCINHESVWREPFAAWATSQMWDLVIADEIHRLKSAGSMSSKFANRLAMRARRRLGLTGTLMPHSPLDVYGQYRFLDRGIFGTNNADFEERYARFGGYDGREVVGFRNLKGLRRRIDTITIHIDDSEQGLPRTVDIKHGVHLPSKARTAYKQLEEEFIADVQHGTITAANSGVKLLRLHQMASGFAPLDSDQKVKDITWLHREKRDGLRDVLADFSKKEPIVIFARFRPDIDAIKATVQNCHRSFGEISGKSNDLAAWKAGVYDVLIAQIQAVKEGVDLTRSSVGIFYSTGISLGDYQQCRKRLHRPPQTRMVRFIHILTTGTRDVSTYRALLRRQDVIKSTLADIRRDPRR